MTDYGWQWYLCMRLHIAGRALEPGLSAFGRWRGPHALRTGEPAGGRAVRHGKGHLLPRTGHLPVPLGEVQGTYEPSIAFLLREVQELPMALGENSRFPFHPFLISCPVLFVCPFLTHLVLRAPALSVELDAEYFFHHYLFNSLN